MKVTFLGTGTSQGVPVIGCDCSVCLSKDTKDKRLRTSAMIEFDSNLIVLDTGPDFRQQMLRENVKRLDGVIFTHEHKDHVAGLDDVRAFNFITKKPVDIYASQAVQEALKREFQYIFSGYDYPGIPKINVHTIKNKMFNIKGLTIKPIEMMHYKMPVFGYRIENFTYITDANYISDEELKKIEGTEILVINALRKTNHLSHFTLKEALVIINKIKPERAFLTHISHQLGLHEEVEKELPSNVKIAFDGLSITV